MRQADAYSFSDKEIIVFEKKCRLTYPDAESQMAIMEYRRDQKKKSPKQKRG